MIRIISSIFLGLALTGCNTTAPLAIPNLELNTRTASSSEGNGNATFALAKVIADIDRGEEILAFPSEPKTSGSLCNHRFGSDAVVTFSGGKQYLGNWSTEIGKPFYETLTNRGFKVAGDPSDMFTQGESVNSAQYLVAGRLTKMKGNFCHEHHWWDGRPLDTFSGEMYVEIEWSVLNTLTKNVLLKDRIGGYYKQDRPIKSGVSLTFENAIVDSIERLFSRPQILRLARGERLDASNLLATTTQRVNIENGSSPAKFKADEISGNVVTIRIGTGHGSGFFVGKAGYVLTNAHVVGSATKVQINTSIGVETEATVVSVNQARDVALLKAPLRISKPLSIKKLLPKVAEEVFAVGSPFKESLSNSVTKGIVSALRTDSASGMRYIQSDAAISPGNSGGPLFDSEGNVIAISVAKYTGRSTEGLGLFIPISDALEALAISLE